LRGVAVAARGAVSFVDKALPSRENAFSRRKSTQKAKEKKSQSRKKKKKKEKKEKKKKKEN